MLIFNQFYFTQLYLSCYFLQKINLQPLEIVIVSGYGDHAYTWLQKSKIK